MGKKRTNETERAVRDLVRLSGFRAETIDSIAGAPDAFDRVLARIKAEQARQESRPRAKVPIFQLAAGFAAAVLLASTIYFSADGIDEMPLPQIAVTHDRPVGVPAEARSIAPPEAFVSEISTKDRAENFDSRVQKGAVKTRVQRREKPPQETLHSASETEPPAEFLSLGLATTPQQTADGGRVIRVDLPAASLFAMGLDVPLENGRETVKADLIVGPDGVTRAVKLVE